MDTDLISINKKEILQFVKEGSNLVLKKDAEASLMALLDLKDYIDSQVELVKKSIAESGKKALGVDFKGIVGDKIKAIYRRYGDRYTTTNPDFQKRIVSVRTDSDKIDGYLEENGELPPSTSETEREEKLVITRIEDKPSLNT